MVALNNVVLASETLEDHVVQCAVRSDTRRLVSRACCVYSQKLKLASRLLDVGTVLILMADGASCEPKQEGKRRERVIEEVFFNLPLALGSNGANIQQSLAGRICDVTGAGLQITAGSWAAFLPVRRLDCVYLPPK